MLCKEKAKLHRSASQPERRRGDVCYQLTIYCPLPVTVFSITLLGHIRATFFMPEMAHEYIANPNLKVIFHIIIKDTVCLH